MTKQLLKRLLGVFSSALAGYVIGWILGWSLVDPNSDVWALTAFVGAIAGLVMAIGLGAKFWQSAGMLFGATIGLFLGWILRTLLFGDIHGGIGSAFVIVGAIAGGFVGTRSAFRKEGRPLWTLTGVLLFGFFGGLLADFIVLILILKMHGENLILWQAPGVILSGAVGGFIVSHFGRG